jgi:hypothetical protein
VVPDIEGLTPAEQAAGEAALTSELTGAVR